MSLNQTAHGPSEPWVFAAEGLAFTVSAQTASASELLVKELRSKARPARASDVVLYHPSSEAINTFAGSPHKIM